MDMPCGVLGGMFHIRIDEPWDAPFTSFIKVEDIQFNLPHNITITMDELQDRLELIQKGTKYIELARGAGQIHSARLTAEGRQYERKRRANNYAIT
jgi:hypothetical protein